MLVTLVCFKFINSRSYFKKQLKNLQIPILVIGTKADLVDDAQRMKQLQRTGNIGECDINYLIYCIYLIIFQFNFVADQCSADEILLNCHEVRSLAAGTSGSVKLARFFDKVIERKYYPRGEAFANDKRKYTNIIPSNFNAGYTQLS